MVARILLILTVLLIYSCSSRKQFPVPKMEKVEPEMIKLNGSIPVFNSSEKKVLTLNGLTGLQELKEQYMDRSKAFDWDIFTAKWEIVRRNTDFTKNRQSDISKWFEITGLLFCLSGDARYSEELERIASSGMAAGGKGFTNVIGPYVFTKDLDNLHVNIFIPVEIDYTHSLGGDVHIEMKTGYPESGTVELEFDLAERRYIEMNIRIPSWAEGARVEVKKVKYVAPPGGYCKIARKWKSGDRIEIDFPVEHMPGDLNITGETSLFKKTRGI